MLVEDDEREIQKAENDGILTKFVRGDSGMTTEDMIDVVRISQGETS